MVRVVVEWTETVTRQSELEIPESDIKAAGFDPKIWRDIYRYVFGLTPEKWHAQAISRERQKGRRRVWSPRIDHIKPL